jgi:hypothetical protein
MVCVRVPLLLKRDVGVLFGVPEVLIVMSPPPLFLAFCGSVSLRCLVVSFLLCYEALDGVNNYSIINLLV